MCASARARASARPLSTENVPALSRARSLTSRLRLSPEVARRIPVPGAADEIREILSGMDLDGDDEISWDEFVANQMQLWPSLQHLAKKPR